MNILIVLGGDDPSPGLLRSQLDWADQVIAADRGVESLMDMGCEPDILTGDLDSVERDISTLNCRIAKESRQNATDFEKALSRADSPSEIHILGAMGRRHDHFITNLLIAADIAADLPVVLMGNAEVLHRVTPQCGLSASFPVGATTSLLPFSFCKGVVAKGLKWELDGVDMGVGAQLGQSNVVASAPLEISIDSGVMYVALQLDSP